MPARLPAASSCAGVPGLCPERNRAKVATAIPGVSMNRLRRALLAVLLAVATGASALAPSFAADESAKAFLQAIYRNYIGTVSKGLRLDKDADYRRHFT